MKKNFKNDMSRDDLARFRKLETVFLSRCRQFGYSEIKTATIQPLHIFTALGALSETKLNRIYSFMDWNGWSGERVALKPDSTTGVARYYGEHLLNENPEQKLCYVENHFEWADAGDEITERWQCGIEHIGSSRPEADFEVIYMALDILKTAGIKSSYLFLSYPAIIRNLVAELNLEKPLETRLLSAIRNKEVDRATEILSKVSENQGTVHELERFLTLPSQSAIYTAAYLKNLGQTVGPGARGLIGDPLQNFTIICTFLDAIGYPYVIDFSLLGDLDYYSGIKFEIVSSPERKSRREILCSGGRYDHLIGRMWDLPENIPSVGFAIFLRNTIGRISAQADLLQNISIYISVVSDRNVKIAQLLCDKLFSLGFDAQITLVPVKPESYDRFGLVIQVDHDAYPDGFQVLHSQKIGKPLLMNLFGELNDR
jgi:histidyl-tRNA synthetase